MSFFGYPSYAAYRAAFARKRGMSSYERVHANATERKRHYVVDGWWKRADWQDDEKPETVSVYPYEDDFEDDFDTPERRGVGRRLVLLRPVEVAVFRRLAGQQLCKVVNVEVMLWEMTKTLRKEERARIALRELHRRMGMTLIWADDGTPVTVPALTGTL